MLAVATTARGSQRTARSFSRKNHAFRGYPSCRQHSIFTALNKSHENFVFIAPGSLYGSLLKK